MRLHRALLTMAIASPAFAGAGMPQLDPTWYSNGVFWLVVCFMALYVAVARVIVPSIAQVIETRENAITTAIREAERAKHEAESTQGVAISESHQAFAKASELMAKVQAENSRDAAEAFAKLDRDLKSRADHAAAVIEDAVAKAGKGVNAAALELAEVITAKLLGAAHGGEESAPKVKLAATKRA